LRPLSIYTAESAATVKTFDATCGGRFAKRFSRPATSAEGENNRRNVMTVREKFEITVFGSALVLGIPALIAASQAIAG
jgi:hypothetical protein